MRFAKFLICGLLAVFLSLAMSCASIDVQTAISPHVYTNNENTEIEIIGEIIYETRERVGYIELLRAARNLYPDCDYVIDIMVDRKVTTTTRTPSLLLLIFLRGLLSPTVETDVIWVMRGTAVRYVR